MDRCIMNESSYDFTNKNREIIMMLLVLLKIMGDYIKILIKFTISITIIYILYQ